MKSSLLFVLPVVLAAADTPQQQRGKKIVADALEALGGARFLEVEDRVESGRAYSFYREQLSGLSRAKIYTRYLSGARSEKDLAIRERQNFGKDEDSGVLFNEDGAYEITFRGARPLSEERLRRYRDTTHRNVFYILRERLKEPGLIVEHRSSEILNNQPVDVVDITDSENRTVTVYFHQSTKLPVKQSFVRRDPATRERDEEVTLYSKYRDVGGGVQWPFTIQRERNGEKIYEIYSESVVINQGLKDDLFTLPSNTKILKK
jgi:hypothetical protein